MDSSRGQSAAAGHAGRTDGRRFDAEINLRLTHRLRFTEAAFHPRNTVLAEVLGHDDMADARVVAFVDSGVLHHHPRLGEQIAEWFASRGQRARFIGPVHDVPGGEACKNDLAALQHINRVINDARLCRRSYVIGIGGGAVLDVVGFAASIAHRGVRLIRFPTTTLAQGDSGVGVKNGINCFGKKNALGAFAVPWAVINDTSFLTTLSERDWRSGWSEAVKVGLVKDAQFFEQIRGVTARLNARDLRAARAILERSAELHLRHIVDGGDPFELTLARPLDFGHWAAHKLEQMTRFELRHGEAVAIGIALDVAYAANLGLLSENEAQVACECLRSLGFELFHPAMLEHEVLLAGLEEFREHLGGRLTVTLPRRIGEGVDVHEIDRRAMIAAIDDLAEAAPRRARHEVA